MRQKLIEENEYVDIATEGVSAKWSSLIAPLMPSLLLSHNACSCLFDTPWRTKTSPVALMRQAAVFLHTAFENDLECQENWLSFCNLSLRSCFQMSAGEVLAWTYTFVFLLMTASGAASVSSFLGLGSLVHRLYLAGCAEAFVSFIYELTCLLQEGPIARAKVLARKKAKVFVLSIVASTVLPKDVLAAHMTSCVLFGFMEKTLKSLFNLAIPSLRVFGCIKDMGNAYSSKIVDAVFRALTRQPACVPATPPLLMLPASEGTLAGPETAEDAVAETIGGLGAEAPDETQDELCDAVPALVSITTGECLSLKLPVCLETPEPLETLVPLETLEPQESSESLQLLPVPDIKKKDSKDRSSSPTSCKIICHQRERPRGHRRSRLSSRDFGPTQLEG